MPWLRSNVSPTPLAAVGPSLRTWTWIATGPAGAGLGVAVIEVLTSAAGTRLGARRARRSRSRSVGRGDVGAGDDERAAAVERQEAAVVVLGGDAERQLEHAVVTVERRIRRAIGAVDGEAEVWRRSITLLTAATRPSRSTTTSPPGRSIPTPIELTYEVTKPPSPNEGSGLARRHEAGQGGDGAVGRRAGSEDAPVGLQRHPRTPPTPRPGLQSRGRRFRRWHRAGRSARPASRCCGLSNGTCTKPPTIDVAGGVDGHVAQRLGGRRGVDHRRAVGAEGRVGRAVGPVAGERAARPPSCRSRQRRSPHQRSRRSAGWPRCG